MHLYCVVLKKPFIWKCNNLSAIIAHKSYNKFGLFNFNDLIRLTSQGIREDVIYWKELEERLETYKEKWKRM